MTGPNDRPNATPPRKSSARTGPAIVPDMLNDAEAVPSKKNPFDDQRAREKESPPTTPGFSDHAGRSPRRNEPPTISPTTSCNVFPGDAAISTLVATVVADIA